MVSVLSRLLVRSILVGVQRRTIIVSHGFAENIQVALTLREVLHLTLVFTTNLVHSIEYF